MSFLQTTLLVVLLLSLLVHATSPYIEDEDYYMYQEDEDDIFLDTSVNADLPLNERNNLIWVGSLDGRLSAYSPQGKMKWSSQLNNNKPMLDSYQSEESKGSGVIVPGDDGSIYIFSNGELSKFPFSVPDFVENSPMYQRLDSGSTLAIVGEMSSRVFQLDPDTGALLNTYDAHEGELYPKFESKNMILMGRRDYRVRAFDQATGKEMWNFTYGIYDPPPMETHGNVTNPLTLVHDLTSQDVPVTQIVGLDFPAATTQFLKKNQVPEVQVKQFAELMYVSTQWAQKKPFNKALPAPAEKCDPEDFLDVLVPGIHSVTDMGPESYLPRSRRLDDVEVAPHFFSTLEYVLFLSIALVLGIGGLYVFRRRTGLHRLKVNLEQIKGYGCNGTIVFKGTLDGRQVAVKRMQSAFYDRANKEIDLLIKSDGHPNVVRYFAKEESHDFVYLALELCETTLDRASEMLEPGQPEVACTAMNTLFLKELTDAVRHLHSLKILHCDIKPQNVLVVPRPGGEGLDIGSQWIPKLSDMGLSRNEHASGFASSLTHLGQSTSKSRAGGGVGTTGWRAAELLMSQAMSNKVDVFSLGCVFFFVLVPGRHPFGEFFERETNVLSNSPDLSVLHLYPEAQALIQLMIQRTAAQRPTLVQCMEMPLLWEPEKKIDFLAHFSDRLEHGDKALLAAIEDQMRVFYASKGWITSLSSVLERDAKESKFRTYKESSFRDLLRYIRNKRAHRTDDASLSDVFSPYPQAFIHEFLVLAFPWLVQATYTCCLKYFAHEEELFARFLGVVVSPSIQLLSKELVSVLMKGKREFYVSEAQWEGLTGTQALPRPPGRMNHKSLICKNYKVCVLLFLCMLLLFSGWCVHVHIWYSTYFVLLSFYTCVRLIFFV